MPYIDTDDLLSKLPDDLPYKSSVKRVLMQAPTADVAPKTEVERLERILNSYALQYGTVTDQQKVIDKAKREVAREIFEEIEKVACVYKLDGDFYIDNGLYAELKKKYTEDKK